MRTRIVSAVCAACTLMVVGAARAQDGASPSDHGAIQIGLRLGYGVPMGNTGTVGAYSSDQRLSDTVAGQFPIGVDLGYRITSHFAVGLWLLYGFGQRSHQSDFTCMGQTTCAIRDTRIGLMLNYHVSPHERVDPWIGIGFGYEWLTFTQNFPTSSTSSTGRGLELGHIQIGSDIILLRTLAVGPFVSFSAGRFTRVENHFDSTTVPQDIESPSLHEWAIFGLRGIYDIPL